MGGIRFLLCMKLLGRELSHQHKKKDPYGEEGMVTVSTRNINKLESVMKYEIRMGWDWASQNHH